MECHESPAEAASLNNLRIDQYFKKNLNMGYSKLQRD
jgi:hypothetical protein